jgi:mannobiose 2-epimerase
MTPTILVAALLLAPPPPAADLAAIGRDADRLVREELPRRWYPAALDRTRGGFRQTFARDWTPLPDANVFAVYQARMTWTAAAFAAYAPELRDEYAAYARHGIAFLDEVVRDRELGGFHWVLGPDGKVDPALGDEKHVYGTAFVLYAAATVRDVLGDERALGVARDAFDWLEAHAHDREHGGYIEAHRRDGTPILAADPDAPLARRRDRMGTYYGFKSMNAHIHLLEAVAALARVDDRPVVRERLAELLAFVRDRIAVEPGALNLYVTRDGRAIPGHDSFGHDIETAFLLLEAAEVLGIPDDPRTVRMARMLVDHTLETGWDEANGGVYDQGEAFAGRIFRDTKVWWTQAEALNALAVMHHRFGRETDRYAKALASQWRFITAHQLDPVHGGWFNEVGRAGGLHGDPNQATQWKANYHTARSLMNVARLLREP